MADRTTTPPPSVFAADEGRMTMGWACTEIACDVDACCNTCTLTEVNIGMQTIDLQRAREVLDLDATVSTCDASAIRDVLQNVRISFSDATCVRHD